MGWLVVERNLGHENHYTPNDLYHANGDQSVSDEDTRVFHQGVAQSDSLSERRRAQNERLRPGQQQPLDRKLVDKSTHTHTHASGNATRAQQYSRTVKCCTNIVTHRAALDLDPLTDSPTHTTPLITNQDSLNRRRRTENERFRLTRKQQHNREPHR